MHRSQESFRRSRFVVVFIDSLLHSPSKTNRFVFVFVYYCESQQASLRKIGPAGHPAGQVGFFIFKIKIF